jgi:hypothetical protein
MSDFFTSLVDRAAGRAPSLERRIPPRFEPSRGRSSTPENIAQDATVQPAIEEIFQETSRLEVAPPRRKTMAPVESPRDAESGIKPGAKEKTAEMRDIPAQSKSPEPVRAIAKVERIVEPVAPVAPRVVQAKPAPIEPPPIERITNASVTPRESDNSSRVSSPRVAPAIGPQSRMSPVTARSNPTPAIQPRITPRAPQVIVQRERSAAPTIQVTIGRIEVRAAAAPGTSSATSRPSGPKLSLEDYLKNRGSR